MGQPALYFDVIEQTAITRFYDHLPHHPSCGDEKPAYLIRAKSIAKKYPYIQANPPKMVSWLIFDIDHGDCGVWMDDNLPPPNIIVRDRETGRGHLYYAIVPVCTSKNGKSHPKRYLKAVRAALGKRLGADTGYTGRISKNPMCDLWAVTSLHAQEYSLGELADYLDLESEKIEYSVPDEQFEPGRNAILFLRLRYWAYRKIAFHRNSGYRQWAASVDAQAHRSNSFKNTPYSNRGPLSPKEVAGIAKSVASWVWDNYTTTKGVMNLAELDIPLEARQRLSARRTHEIRANRSEAKIKEAIASLTADAKPITKAAVSRLTGLSRQQIANRYAHLFNQQAPTAPELPVNDASAVKFGGSQIAAPRAALFAVHCPPATTNQKTGQKPMTYNNDSNSRSGGEAAKGSRSGGKAAFTKICGMLAIIEKINLKDGVTPKFGYNDRARITRVIISQKIPLLEAELLAGRIADLAADLNYSHMSTADWCAYSITACRDIKQKIISKMAEKRVKFDAFLNGENVYLTDGDLPELAAYAREKEENKNG